MLVLMGLVIVLMGGLVWLLGRSGFRGLSGDIRYETQSGGFYLPIGASLVL